MSPVVRLEALTASSSAGFEQPFEMLRACHERVERTLGLLARLREHLRTHGADAQAREAAADVLRYFNLAAPQHHRDEELHVFPPLLRQGPEPLRAVVRRLQQDHARMEALWRPARAVLDAVAAGQAAPLSPGQEQALEDFAGLYGEHIAAEEQLAYPAARALLDQGARAAMGAEMRQRRGVAPG